jgi:quercetin dioxygenase-like cupin family protein
VQARGDRELLRPEVLRVNAAGRPAIAAAALLWAGAASAQDPLVLLPQAYKLVLENEWVKVVRVRYEPRAKLPLHDHTEMAAAYVYLNDAGPVLFAHDYGEMTRPATKAGSFRIYKAVKETHTVSNPNDVASEFLRVELKTQPLDEDSFRGRFHRDANADAGSTETVQLDHPQLRVTRYLMAPRQKLDVSAKPDEPSLLIATTAGRLEARRGEAVEKLELEPGNVGWVQAGDSVSFDNAGPERVELLRFDLKTRPLAAP